MNFDLTEDEELLKALAERFVTDHYDIERRRDYLAGPAGFSPTNWALLGELGLIAAPFDAEAGGLGIDATGIATVVEAFGRGLVVEPLIENAILAGRLFATSASDDLAASWLPDLLTGARRVALAHAEPAGRPGLTWIATRATTDGDTAELTGAKSCVPSGAGADAYLVSIRDSGLPADGDGVALYLVPADTPGLSVREWRMADGSLAVSLDLQAVRVPAANRLTGTLPQIDAAQNLANLARAAEALGIMERIFAETQEYLRTREQFGQPLASFQAVQHRMVAQYASIEQSRSLLHLALVSEGTDDFAETVHGLRAFVSAASITLGHEMMQFHGGMGVTDELSIGHAHKRLLVLSRWPDDPDVALERFAGLLAG